MTDQELDKLKFPIGKFESPERVDPAELKLWINTIAGFPVRLGDITRQLPAEKLIWKYRPGGWTIKQVVHHCADSHMNSYIRFKLALTENTPVIRPYFENRWAELPESKEDDISSSLDLIVALHNKWTKLIQSLDEEQLSLSYVHPETNEAVGLKNAVGLYAWHCNHHYQHVSLAIEAKGFH